MKVLFKVSLLAVVLLISSPTVAEDAIAFIFSGYKSSPQKELYQKIGNTFEQNGIRTEYVEIDWSTGSIHSYIEQGRSVLKEKNADKYYFYGFSLGGLIALSLSSEFRSESVLVSSIAPFFKEDIEALSWYSPQKIYNWWNFGDSDSVALNELLARLNSQHTKVTLLVGERERDVMLNRSRYISDNLKNSRLVVMNNIGHGISEPGHMGFIVNEIQKQMPNN